MGRLERQVMGGSRCHECSRINAGRSTGRPLAERGGMSLRSPPNTFSACAIREAENQGSIAPRSRRRTAASRYAIGGTAFLARTEEQVEQRRSGRVQDRDLDLPRRTVALDEIDAAVAEHYGVDQRLFSAPVAGSGRRRYVAVELAARLADMSGRAIGAHYGIGATAGGRES